jgi:hypothetical protein
MLALIAGLCAFLSKTATCTLPAALALVLWWKRGRLRWRDVLALLPLFILAVGSGLMTVWVEKAHVGAEGEDWALSPVARCLVAGRALWFYVAKLVWPSQLTFIYPRWHIDTGAWWQYLFPLTAAAFMAILWLLRRRIGTGPLAAVLFFAGTLAPVLGFVNFYFMRLSFVADHLQYLPSIGLLVLAAALISRALQPMRRGPSWARPVMACVLIVLGTVTWTRGLVYRDAAGT